MDADEMKVGFIGRSGSYPRLSAFICGSKFSAYSAVRMLWELETRRGEQAQANEFLAAFVAFAVSRKTAPGRVLYG